MNAPPPASPPATGLDGDAGPRPRPAIDRDPLVPLEPPIRRCLPPFTGVERRVAVALYRALARGEPAKTSVVARSVGTARTAVDAILGRWPCVFRDRSGRIVSFCGLSLLPMGHRFEVGGRLLSVWCAWDAFVLPAILGAPARVVSYCLGTGAEVRIEVAPERIVSADPPTAVVSFPPPAVEPLCDDPLGSFCRHARFFRSAEAAAGWVEGHPGAGIVPLGEALEAGRREVALRYGDAVAARPHA